MEKQPQISFIIPAKNEEKSIGILTREIISVCKKMSKTFEIIFIDDGSKDKTYKEIERLAKKHKEIVGIKHRRNFGKAVALSTGFNEARGNIIITLDADLQDNPRDIPKFLEKFKQGYDLISGWKKKRNDPFLSKVLPSRIINFLARLLTGVKIHDTNCGFKAYKIDVLRNIEIRGELYRFIPALAQQKGFKVAEVIVNHRKRLYGKSKYGWSRCIKGLIDLLTVTFLTGFSSKPGHFFGIMGILLIIPGFTICSYITYLRITTGGIAYRYPLLFLGVLLIIVGIQFISTGLLAELILIEKKTALKEAISERTKR